ncbi:GNAT family N-acetyltransferase, partial [Clostridium botulinum]|uniref:GNAT family N-acetyltransferase n=1 Tax=Clostridium botulinum TaxID=1491 RepID=UPI001E5C15A4
MRKEILRYKVSIDTDTNFNDNDYIEQKVTQDYKINILIQNDDTETVEYIGEMDITIFDLKYSYMAYEDETMLAFDLEGETADLYESFYYNGYKYIFDGYIDILDMISECTKEEKMELIKKEHIVYLRNLYIYKEYRGKGYGKEVLRNIEKVLRYIFNLNINSIIGIASPSVKNDEGFEFTNSKKEKEQLKDLLTKNNYIFLTKKKVSDYFI